MLKQWQTFQKCSVSSPFMSCLKVQRFSCSIVTQISISSTFQTFFFHRFEERKEIFFSKKTSEKNVKTCCLRLSISTVASLWLIIRRSNWESPPVNTDKGWSDTSWSLAAAAARLINMKPPELGVNPTTPELRLRRWNTHFWGRLSFHSLKILHAFFFPFLFSVFLFPSAPIPISSKHL